MNFLPDYSKVCEIAESGKYDILPVSCEILADFITPIEALRILKRASEHVYMLESARADDTWGRYTFLGYDPKLLITCKDGRMKVGDREIVTEHPAEVIREILSDNRSPRIEQLPPFTGGLVGYFSFEYLT